ncbi:MAG: YgiT-type zinc finger protein [Candidatus Aenigmarchaeota archaeon]|nr:YgiT-type zinc finger protein [Candidatus Aenigmarchaeota archaeon]
MLSNKKEEVENMKEIQCGNCGEEMKRVTLPVYEYMEGFPLHDVKAYQCQKCGEIFFTEEDADNMEKRTKVLEKNEFGFERKVTVSGGSKVIPIPHELVTHLHLRQGQILKVVPVARQGFLVKKTGK